MRIHWAKIGIELRPRDKRRKGLKPVWSHFAAHGIKAAGLIIRLLFGTGEPSFYLFIFFYFIEEN